MNTHPARGMRDFLPEDVRRRQYVIGVIADVYQRYGFEPLETPAVENIETLMGKYGEEGDRLIFRILKRGEEGKTGEADLALRYDLTVPLARVVAQYRAQLPKYFKRYQVQPVWRADRPQKGRFREFYQCDVDAIGSTSLVIEAELLSAGAEVLNRLGFHDFRIRLNHRKLLSGMLRTLQVSAEALTGVIASLDKFDKVGAEGVSQELLGKGLEAESVRNIVGFFGDYGPEAFASGQATNAGALKAGWTRFGGDPEAAAALGELTSLLELCGASLAGQHVQIDFTLARGLSYYTGAIFEITVPDLAGSLGGGGRYDELIGMFLGQRVPACGISLGLERILVVMAERGMFPPTLTAAPADVMVTIWNAHTAPDAIRLAGELRAGGLRADLYPEPDKIGKQFKYADSRGVRFVTIVGEAESERGDVAVKNLKTGEQQVMPRAAVAAFIKRGSGA
jgi:histidyl-tRNA synthetase